MRRCLFTVASVVSLLLCLATVMIWVRSHWIQDYAWKSSPSGNDAVLLFSSSGRLNLFRAGRFPRVGRWALAFDGVAVGNSYSPAYGISTPNSVQQADVFDIQFIRCQGWLALPQAPMATSRPAVPIVSLGFSWLWLAGLFTVLPLIDEFSRIRRRLLRARSRRGACSLCGYNLTGNTSGVCPECGTAITTPAALTGPVGRKS